MLTLRIKVLGPLEVCESGAGGPDDRAVRLPAGRARTILALLCANAGHVVSQDRLIESAWNGTPPASAATRLHGFISVLRRALPAPAIRTSGAGYLLDVSIARIDLHEARELITLSRSHREQGDIATAARCLDDALALWRGTPFDGIDCTVLAAEADRIRQQHVDVLEDFAELELQLGHHAALVSRLSEWTARYPLREGLRSCLMRALAGSGRQADAIATYQELRQLLGDELGVDPAPHLQKLYTSIITGDKATLSPHPRQAPAGLPRPAQLPADTSDFTGRAQQVQHLCSALSPAAGPPVTMVISGISGTGGVGKSALAVHVAHQVADVFGDGQLYVNLAGTSGDPLPPGTVLARLLRDLGFPEDKVPSDESERATCYRSLLSGRNVLLVLDDARDAAQVRPLLPGTAGCAVLVTSRSGLADLEGARLASLDVMPAAEAHKLLRTIAGSSRVDAEPRAADRLLQACAGLPLAIRIAGAKLAARPGWSIEAFAVRLATEHRRLAELRVGDLAVRASFQLSYDTLDTEFARMFRMLGIAGTNVFGAGQTGALCGVDSDRAEELLDGLTDVHMLQSPAPGIYRLHDLLRLFANEIAETSVPRDDRDAAIGRLLTWYALALHDAAQSLAQGRSMPPEAEPLPEWTGAEIPAFETHKAALEWCQAEYTALVWAIEQAARRERPALAVNMACWLWMYATRTLVPDGHVMTQEVGLECARALGAEPAQAWLLNGMGSALARRGEYERAADSYAESLELRRRIGDESGCAASLNNIGNVRHNQGRYAEAVEHYQAAITIAEVAGLQNHVATILVNAANSYREMAAYALARDAYGRALEINRAAGQMHGVASCLGGLGETLRRTGRLTEALGQIELALAIHRDLGSTDPDFLDALDTLAQVYAASGRPDEARSCWAEAASLAGR